MTRGSGALRKPAGGLAFIVPARFVLVACLFGFITSDTRNDAHLGKTAASG